MGNPELFVNLMVAMLEVLYLDFYRIYQHFCLFCLCPIYQRDSFQNLGMICQFLKKWENFTPKIDQFSTGQMWRDNSGFRNERIGGFYHFENVNFSFQLCYLYVYLQ